jgi:hypothetical protein
MHRGGVLVFLLLELMLLRGAGDRRGRWMHRHGGGGCTTSFAHALLVAARSSGRATCKLRSRESHSFVIVIAVTAAAAAATLVFVVLRPSSAAPSRIIVRDLDANHVIQSCATSSFAC